MYMIYFNFAERENLMMNDEHDNENGIDIESDNGMPNISDIDGIDHDPNDIGRPRKIRR